MEPGFWQLLIILVIVLLLFGTKKLRNIGGDLGGAVKSFRSAMRDGENKSLSNQEGGHVFEADAAHHEEHKRS